MATKWYRPREVQNQFDKQIANPDAVPVTYSVLSDEFDDKGMSGVWSWNNQGSATWTEDNGYGSFFVPNDSSGNQRTLERTVSSSTVTITMKFSSGFIIGNYNGFGLCFRNSSTDKRVNFGINYDSAGSAWGNIDWTTWTGPTSFNSRVERIAILPQYLRMASDGTNIKCYFSFDGVAWVKLQSSLSLASWISSIDRIGLYGYCTNSVGDSTHAVHWFRVS